MLHSFASGQKSKPGVHGTAHSMPRRLTAAHGMSNHRLLQRRAASTGEFATVPPIVHEVLASPGQPLDVGTRAYMEPRFGHDFSHVRVHADSSAAALTINKPNDAFEQEAERVAVAVVRMSAAPDSAGHDFSRVRIHADPIAAESARAINALAYTAGNHIIFGQGQYKTTTNTGQQLLAHELTHVLQQSTRSDPVIQRQTAEQPGKGKRGGLKTGSHFRIKGGELKVAKFDLIHTWYLSEKGYIGYYNVEIELAYTRGPESEYADPSKINWFQTFRTNYDTTFPAEVPPKDTAIIDYVDGVTTNNKQEARWFNEVNGSILEDGLGRKSLEDRDVYWKAESSAVGISDNGLEILATVEWGFQMDRKGHPKGIPHRSVTTPSSYHLLKFQELRVKEE